MLLYKFAKLAHRFALQFYPRSYDRMNYKLCYRLIFIKRVNPFFLRDWPIDLQLSIYVKITIL